jgi:hypothetical protein
MFHLVRGDTTWLTTTTDGQLISIEPSVQNRLRGVKNRDGLLYGVDFRGVRSKGSPAWLYVYDLGHICASHRWRSRGWFGQCGQRCYTEGEENHNS